MTECVELTVWPQFCSSVGKGVCVAAKVSGNSKLTARWSVQQHQSWLHKEISRELRNNSRVWQEKVILLSLKNRDLLGHALFACAMLTGYGFALLLLCHSALAYVSLCHVQPCSNLYGVRKQSTFEQDLAGNSKELFFRKFQHHHPLEVSDTAKRIPFLQYSHSTTITFDHNRHYTMPKCYFIQPKGRIIGAYRAVATPLQHCQGVQCPQKCGPKCH